MPRSTLMICGVDRSHSPAFLRHFRRRMGDAKFWGDTECALVRVTESAVEPPKGEGMWAFWSYADKRFDHVYGHPGLINLCVDPNHEQKHLGRIMPVTVEFLRTVYRAPVTVEGSLRYASHHPQHLLTA